MTTSELLSSIRELAASGAQVSKWESQIWERFGCRRAVLVLDSTGFTRVTHSHGVIHFLLMLSRVREIVAGVFQQHGCIYYRPFADNVHAHFETPSQAFDAAVAANRAVRNERLMITSSEPFTLCIGIGYGELLDSGTEGLFGTEMNFASKLGEDVAEGREILLTRAAWEHLPADRQSLFEERYHGLSDQSVRFYWMHCDR